MKIKSIIYLLGITILFSLSCKDEDDLYIAPCGKVIAFNACGVNDIGNNLVWLKILIENSKNDLTGNYMGRIWFKKFNNQDLIITDMSLDSGGLAYHVFDCSGQNIVIDDNNLYSSLTEHDILWTKICID